MRACGETLMGILKAATLTESARTKATAGRDVWAVCMVVQSSNQLNCKYNFSSTAKLYTGPGPGCSTAAGAGMGVTRLSLVITS